MFNKCITLYSTSILLTVATWDITVQQQKMSIKFEEMTKITW